MSKHTPGPWGICKWDSKTIEARIQYLHEDDEDAEPESIVVADVYGGDLEGREADANARLIAAAPEMLELLQSIVNDYDANSGVAGEEDAENLLDAFRQIHKEASRLVSKATGE